MNILTNTELQNDNSQSKTTIETVIRNSLFEVIENCNDVNLDYWVIMPNHVHFIVAFGQNPTLIKTNKKLFLSDFIKSFKLLSQKRIVAATSASPSPETPETLISSCYNKDFNYNKLWQKSFFDHIIRDGNDLE